MKLKDKIKRIEKQRKRIMGRLLLSWIMIPGSYSSPTVKCGKPNCWCAKNKKKGHVSLRITWMENGQSKTKAVTNKNIRIVQQAINKYKEYKSNRKEVDKLNLELKMLLDHLGKEWIEKSRKLNLFQK